MVVCPSLTVVGSRVVVVYPAAVVVMVYLAGGIGFRSISPAELVVAVMVLRLVRVTVALDMGFLVAASRTEMRACVGCLAGS